MSIDEVTTDAVKPQLLQRVLEHSNPSAHRPLGFLEGDPEVYELATDPAPFLKSLEDDFAAEDLLQSGLARQTSEGSLHLTDALHRGQPFLVLREAEGGLPYEFLTPTGCLAPKSLPVFEILKDAWTRQRLAEGEEGDLFVAFDFEDVLLLRACGLPATLAHGLENLPLEDLGRFHEAFGVFSFYAEGLTAKNHDPDEQNDPSGSHPADPFRPRPESSSSSSQSIDYPDAQLVILGWTPSKLSEAMPRQLKTLADSFHELSEHLGLDLCELGLWTVSEKNLQRLQFIARRENAEFFQEALREATEPIVAGFVKFGEPEPEPAGPPTDYPEALSRLRETTLTKRSTGIPGPSPRQEAWNAVHTLLNQQIVQPLRQEAMATGDPLERTLLLGAAEVSQLFHLESVAMTEALRRRLAGRGTREGDPFPQEQFKNLMELSEKFLKLTKAAQQCQAPRPILLEATSQTSATTPCLPLFESPPGT